MSADRIGRAHPDALAAIVGTVPEVGQVLADGSTVTAVEAFHGGDLVRVWLGEGPPYVWRLRRGGPS